MVMKAVVLKKFGAAENLKIESVPAPVLKNNEFLVKVYATSVTSADRRIRSLNLPLGFGLIGRLVYGFSKPKKAILGTELSGVVERIGSQITRFKVGDRVVSMDGFNLGAYAQYKCFKESDAVALMPEGMTFEEAGSFCFGAATAWVYLSEKTQLYPSNRILINGAGGSVGSAAVQIAKHLGAHVTAVCSEKSFNYVKSIGADVVMDYRTSKFYERAETYDVIMDVTGNLGYFQVRRVLKENGRLLLLTASLPQMLEALFANYILGKKVYFGPVMDSASLIEQIFDLFKQKILKPTVEKVFSLEQIADAHRYAETQSRQGNIAVKVAEP